jgi:hypothetical protein
MVQAPDLARPEWQKSVSDAQIARIIMEGRGRMPSFSLPKPTVDALVKLVRLIGGQRPTEANAVKTGAGETPDSDASVQAAGERNEKEDGGGAAPASLPRTSKTPNP